MRVILGGIVNGEPDFDGGWASRNPRPHSDVRVGDHYRIIRGKMAPLVVKVYQYQSSAGFSFANPPDVDEDGLIVSEVGGWGEGSDRRWLERVSRPIAIKV